MVRLGYRPHGSLHDSLGSAGRAESRGAVMRVSRRGRAIGLGLSLAATAAAGMVVLTVVASAGTASTAVYSGCLNHKTRTLYRIHINATRLPTCFSGDARVKWNARG